MFSNRTTAIQLMYVVFICWIVWQIAFIRGYQDAENDLARKGYDFREARRAFK